MPQRQDVRIAVLAPIPALLREHGREPRRLLAGVGLDESVFAHPDHRIPFATAGALLEACAKATGETAFGLLVASRFRLEQLGLLAPLMRNSRTVGDALANLVRHLHVNDRGAVPYLLDLGQGHVALGYVVYRHDTPGIAHVYDLAIGVGCEILRTLCGAAWKPVRVALAYARPRNPRPWQRHFGAPVEFDAPHSEIVFTGHWLAHRIANTDAGNRRAAERAALALEADGGRIAPRVERIVYGLVMTGDAKAQRVSTLLGLHERALRRRLHDEGTSLHRLVSAARLEIAQQLLAQTRLPVAEIAAALHYADATAFSRAFRRAALASPTAWRARSRGAAGRG
ncbi:MAG: AraC family transcriptional regulator [Burkholderiales bacterium]